MKETTDFREWLHTVRFSRSVCMLLPMEACMGHPVVINCGKEYLLPFFKVSSAANTDTLSPPFAYIRVSYPEAVIFTYNRLRTLPRWRSIDWETAAEMRMEAENDSKVKEYYDAVCSREGTSPSFQQLDALLLDCLRGTASCSPRPSPLVMWYEMLIDEAKKYR